MPSVYHHFSQRKRQFDGLEALPAGSGSFAARSCEYGPGVAEQQSLVGCE